jgi:hypothetical protein
MDCSVNKGNEKSFHKNIVFDIIIYDDPIEFFPPHGCFGRSQIVVFEG